MMTQWMPPSLHCNCKTHTGPGALKLSALSRSSEMRCFRYVGTLTACHVATSLVRVMLTLSEERETAHRQDAAEARKKGAKASLVLCTSCNPSTLSSPG